LFEGDLSSDAIVEWIENCKAGGATRIGKLF